MYYINKDRAYSVGTFKLGQRLWAITDTRQHYFYFNRDCIYCDSTGYIKVKDTKFVCPSCKNKKDTRIVKEAVLDDMLNSKEMLTVRSITRFINNKEERETYSSSSDGNGLIIQKDNNGNNYFFASKELAQEACDKINEKNNVKELLTKYRATCIKEEVFRAI